MEIESCELDTIKSPFKPSECESFEILLPPEGRLTGLSFITDEDYLLPILYRINPESPIYDQIPIRHYFSKSWIINIGDDKPCTANGAKETIKYLQTKDKHQKIVIGFCPIIDPIRHNYQNYRAIFDSMTALRHAHMATLSSPPKAHNTFWGCLDSEHTHHWIKAAYRFVFEA